MEQPRNIWDQHDSQVEAEKKNAEAAANESESNRLQAGQAEAATAKDVKDYNLGDNAKELAKAVVGGGIDIYNSVASLPKLLDPEFYQPDDPENPYKYNSPLLINKTPITRTRWGKFIRAGTELAGGFVGTGKVVWGIKGLKGIATAAKVSRWGRVGMGAAQGAIYDAISNQSQEGNLAAALIDVKPEWSGILSPIATTEDMSPAQRAAMNVGEGLGIGPLFDWAFEAAGWGVRSYSKSAKKAAKKASIAPDPINKAIEASSDIDYALKTAEVESIAKLSYEKAEYRKAFNKKEVDVKFSEWRDKTKPWEKLDKKSQENMMGAVADKKNMDWGETRQVSRRQVKQLEANEELAQQQLEFDLSNGGPSNNPAYYSTNEITDNQALSSSSKPVKGVRDMIEIRNNPTQKYGSPRGTMTEANIRRVEYSAPGTITRERDALAKRLVAEPAYQKLYGTAMPKEIAADLADASRDLIQFVSDSGHSRLVDIPQEDVIKYIKAKDAGKPTVIEGIGTLNKAQLVATDTILGQLLYEARDLAKAAISVTDQIDVAADGSLLDGILARYAAVARMRKETSLLSSFNLRRFNSGGKLKDTVAEAQIRGKASEEAAATVTTFKTLLKGDLDNDLLESFIHFTATNNGGKQQWKDLNTFFSRKLQGYRNADQYQRNAILNELQTMGVNSMLSGPKTPVRALVGTGLGTVMRPVATILGSIGKSDDMVLRGAYANLGGMIDARNEAWRLAVADFQSYNLAEDGWRGFTKNTQDQEWAAMMSWADQYGTPGQQAQAHMANSLRELNKKSWLNYGPRIMKSMDIYFSQLIARGRQRQLAFNDVYSRVRDQGIIPSDVDLEDLIKASELEFEGKVFSGDGQITDEMAKFAADEAKLTQELTGFAKDLDKVFEKQPFLRPFFLFARTGVNALKMTSKYTPVLNNFITEHADIMSKQWDHPDMIQYGIKTADDLEIARATMRGRMAIGYGVTATASWMALNGQITGNGPPDRQLRDSWRQFGWQPRSIKIGNAYISYEALEPFNSMLSFVADIVDSQKVMGDAWASNHFGKVSYLISANVTNKTFLAGLLQLQDLITSQGGDASRVASNFVNNQIPLSGMRNEIGKILSPGLRELESGFWQGVQNRNLWADVFTNGAMVPYKYDVLDGSKINDWNPLQRLLNGVLPIQLNATTNSTRELLFRSGLNLKQTFNTGPKGVPLEGYPNLKSRYQFFLGQQNLEGQLAKVLNHPQVLESIKTMEEDRAKGATYDPDYGSFHGRLIRPIFREAKKKAWQMLLEDSMYGLEARRLTELHRKELLGNAFRARGNYTEANQIQEQIKALENKPIK